MASQSRTARLDKFFSLVLEGKRLVTKTEHSMQLLEAILEQSDHAACVERIIASPAARNAIHAGLRFNIKPEFLNNHASSFILYLADSSVKKLCNGQFLQEILDLIVEPCTVWNAFMKTFQEGRLIESATEAFAWLLVELLASSHAGQIDAVGDAHKVVASGSLLQATSTNTRRYGHQLQQILQIRSSSAIVIHDPTYMPGGRHDNDYADFRKIAIYPTCDEFQSTHKPFYRRAEEALQLPVETRVLGHLDNQFRLLREDMLSEIREGFQIASGTKKKRRMVTIFHTLALEDVFYVSGKRQYPCGLVISCQGGLDALTKLDRDDRKAFLKNDRGYVRHQSFGCLVRGQEIVSFARIDRQIDYLLNDPPEIVLRIIGAEATRKTLLHFKLYKDIKFMLVDAPVFAYEPVLQCLQDKVELPLANELLDYQQESAVANPQTVPLSLVDALCDRCKSLQDILNTEKPIALDPSQTESLLCGLTQSVSLIQGPPGTGKSFVGALIAKALYKHSKETIMVMCYTNHALDQFLEDLLDIGIDQSAIVRLGSKSSARTAQLSLSAQKSNYSRNSASWRIIDELRMKVSEMKESFDAAFNAYSNFKLTPGTILEFLEFEECDFFDAFTPPEQDDGMILVGENGKSVTTQYLYDRWSQGKHHSMPSLSHLSGGARQVWEMEMAIRRTKIASWTQMLLEEQVANVQSLMSRLDKYQEKVDRVWGEQTRDVLRSKRIIGCTTTAAAMNVRDLNAISPGVVLLEEAGEILESHVLTAIGSQAKQLIMIGDHKQLRPKINNYALSVEKGTGYDLNRSLFERLVEQGYPHCTLARQHRMVPEISSLVRNLTYPDLLDDKKTLNRPAARGLQDRVIFIDHTHPEGLLREVSDRHDIGGKGSKHNSFEAQLVLKIVRYLGQQGYGTDKLVVLTPYLGQLHLLREELGKEADPVLNDLDSYDLVRAGLLSQASAKHIKRPIKLSTIDNYQGEESEIVIATLTRSNQEGDIGFMSAPQRLNVLLSRARNVLIMIGNSKTFNSSRKGKEIWTPFINQLQASGQLYDGLPVKCEQHPSRKAVLKTTEDFETLCPDGGCEQPCGTKLNCGIHDCPQKCHQLSDHSKMQCHKIMESTCTRSHKITRPCFQQHQPCHRCVEEDEEVERRRKRDMELDIKRNQKQKDYMLQLALVKDEIDHERRIRQEQNDDQERQRILQQHRDDLERIRTSAIHSAQGSPKGKNTPDEDNSTFGSLPQPNEKTPAEPSMNVSKGSSGAAQDWEYQKKYEGAQSKELDQLMSMIGLESIKTKFLAIKAQVDAALRQNVDFKDDRFGSVLLGNPGTGKTTVARIYAKFLTSMGILPGSFIIETTGSRLANGGVSDCEKQINKILNNGGGVLFIDEAYQLAQSGGMGPQVMDFLLPEIESLTGKIVVVLAGYRKQMEKFFAHNPGLPSRFPLEFVFEDYDEKELRSILEYKINKKFKGRMKLEGGMGGLYSRIVARRISRQRGHEGFGNARTVENVLSRILERQANRLSQERRTQRRTDDFLLTMKDLIGPEPNKALQGCSAWKDLLNMIGLTTVKNTVRALMDSIQSNYARELQEEPLVDFTLNRVFLGSPGTGKTTVAKLYGQILVDIGYLSNGEVIVKNPADFVGSVIGQSEQNTKGILASTIGKVLVIDEAYGLFGGGTRDRSGAQTNQYKTAVVDTIVSEVQSVPGDDRCVLLLGYQEQMTEMFQNVNPGLSRRFPLDAAFVFEDFSDDELGQILDLKLKQQGFQISGKGRKVAMEILSRARNRPHFGNAGEIDILLNGAKIRQQQRRSSGNQNAVSNQLEPQDLDPDYDRGERGETNIPMLFQGTVGCEKIIDQLESYRRTVRNMRQLEMDPKEQVPFNFLFRGPPGTGKTSTARKMGKVYYDMGLLSSAEVLESSATDLVGQYIGQTGPKTQELLEKAMGKVLLVDEAYRLAEGQFAKEAIDEIVDCITKPKFFQKVIIILAGYDKDINRLLDINPGLTSRFPESLEFKGLDLDDCIKLLTTWLQRKRAKLLSRLDKFDLSALESPRRDFHTVMANRFSILTRSANWANARDVETLGKAIFGEAIQGMGNKEISIGEGLILSKIDHMISERTSRAAEQAPVTNPIHKLFRAQTFDRQPAKPVLTTVSSSPVISERAEEKKPAPPVPETASVPRDDGVSDAVWNQLQQDKQAAEIAENKYQTLLEDERAAQKEVEELANTPADSSEPDDEAKRQHEQRRLQELEIRAKVEALRKKREAEEEARRKEQKVQQKLRSMGVCPMGFRWIKQASGYRCGGGTHFVSKANLGI
ncbi:P-loop containing nucleoside triphosphate hydrolase protein [Aspergillus cavernicola]|uniref:P-loop containing nucleoside triphosphate hydrolase protein n=1 Tax=Aspergillus cavernicola TaxID=176166 RepID=A0ABR4IFZ9_9EURO